MLIWNDDTGVRHFGTPAMVEKFENSNKCLGCSENKWDDSAKSVSLKIAKKEYKFEFDNNATTEDIVKVVYKNDNRKIPLLPCPVDLMNQAQFLLFTEEVKKKKIAIRGIQFSVSSAIAVVQETQESS